MFAYAQIDEAGLCWGVSESPTELAGDHIVLLHKNDLSYLGKRYDREAGQWDGVDPQPEPSAVPDVVSRFQARAALYMAGHLDAIEALMQDESTPALARIAWQDAQEFKRQSPTVLAMAGALGLTDDAVDELFVAAAKIEA